MATAHDGSGGGRGSTPPPAPGAREAGPAWPSHPPAPGAAPRPLAPPTAWQADHHGPGSPAGSVRPPDTTGTVAPPRRRRRGGGFLLFLGGLLGAVIGSLLTLGVTGTLDTAEPDSSPPATGEAAAPTINIEGDDPTIVTAVAQAVTPSVVRIDVIGAIDGAEQELGLGSGVIYRSDGYILTNNHVVEAADGVRVKLSSGEEYEADVIGTDPLSDLAIVHIDAEDLPAIALREGSPVVGETAIAIGSPFGLDASVTAGVVSAVGRDITVPEGNGQVQVVPAVIQTDAAINPGNSGGALVDREGRLLGINTAILSGSGGSQGVGFAIPTDQAVTTADQLIEGGEARHAFLGVSGVDVTSEIAERLELQRPRSGALLQEITPGSGADDAGLQVDDVVTEVEGRDITSVIDLVSAIRRFEVGDDIEVTFVRDGEEQTVTVTLGERPGEDGGG